MKIVRLEDVKEIAIISPRQGVLRSRQLVTGEVGTPGNFSFQFDGTDDDRFSPRHRHNFDQFRYQIESQMDFGRNGTMTPGSLGYFPEGTFYGPQKSGAKSVHLVLQFGGASGEGYMSNEQKEFGISELKKVGVFEKGVFRRNADSDGKKNVDGYQAAWEFVHKRPMLYPPPRYHDPLLMDPAKFKWLPVAGQPGAHEKLMGVFTERRTEALFLKLDAGATYRAEGRRLYFMLDGAGVAAERPYTRHTTLYCDVGDVAQIAATTPTEILVLGLPRFDLEQRAAA